MSWVRAVVAVYRFHEGNLTRSVQRQYVSCPEALGKLFDSPSVPAEMAPLRHEAFARMHLHAAAPVLRDWRCIEWSNEPRAGSTSHAGMGPDRPTCGARGKAS